MKFSARNLRWANTPIPVVAGEELYLNDSFPTLEAAAKPARRHLIEKLQSAESAKQVFERLSQDASRRCRSAQRLQAERAAVQEALAQPPPERKMSAQRIESMVERLTADAQRRHRSRELKRIYNEEQTTQALQAARLKRHPKRALNLQVQRRLLEEDKVITACYALKR